MEKFHKICINCPAGCHLDITRENGEISVSGNTCPRGVKYAQQELTDPRRVVTAVVFAAGEKRICIPVKTSAPLAMELIPELLKELFATKVPLPVETGDIIIKNFRSSGVDVIASSDCRSI